ncbi:chloramphenicol phosphotransferase [Devosia rhodophyticola]|uniref:Chloramphenicol phosphotransferase n=1 Tax=Devosia rhodophyticola TaxID=3026423 RepID=A0ABY7YSS5_9HYPH|nr:chloramphenicol phosphotransferase [Devosia rhodophyticola]WDR04416.1 chloramphenicol phosphotransferase [Devosia rhodophyticola]
MQAPGQIVILNGAPRAGKTSIARAIQNQFDGVWINLGVDACNAMLPSSLLPGIGLRPGGERPDLEPLLPSLFAALYGAINAHARLGLNVVVDVGHHDGYSRPLGILPACARQLSGLPVLFVGVYCGLETIMARRNAEPNGGLYLGGETAPAPVKRWQTAVHRPGIYDLCVHADQMDPAQCAKTIAEKLDGGIARPSAFERLAAG